MRNGNRLQNRYTDIGFEDDTNHSEPFMAPITLQRFVKELEKIRQELSDGILQPENYDSRLARVISELRERGLDADRAAATLALADAVTRGVITRETESHLQSRLTSSWSDGRAP